MNLNHREKTYLILLALAIVILMGLFASYYVVISNLYSGIIEREEAMNDFTVVDAVWIIAGILLVIYGFIVLRTDKQPTKIKQEKER